MHIHGDHQGGCYILHVQGHSCREKTPTSIGRKRFKQRGNVKESVSLERRAAARPKSAASVQAAPIPSSCSRSGSGSGSTPVPLGLI